MLTISLWPSIITISISVGIYNRRCTPTDVHKFAERLHTTSESGGSCFQSCKSNLDYSSYGGWSTESVGFSNFDTVLFLQPFDFILVGACFDDTILHVADLNQKIYYLACSLCNQSTTASTASGDNEFFCNLRVTTTPKIKFQVTISDLTDSIDAMVFAGISKQYYGITRKDIDTSEMDGSLPLPLLEKLSQPRNCSIKLKAEMNNYGGLNHCKFIVLAIFDSPPQPLLAGSKHALALEPPTP